MSGPKPARATRGTGPARPPAVRLDPARVHAWRVERQLLGRSRGQDPVAVAERLVGVQAQVSSSAALAIALRQKPARGRHPTVEATSRALAERRLVRAWAMRGTLHLFAAQDVPTIAAALGRREMWRRPAWLRWFGVSEPEMERLLETIGEVLDDGVPRTRAELSVEIGDRLGHRIGKLLLGSWGSALKIASEHHYLVQASGEDAAVRFVRASRWIPGWREERPERALATLVDRYLAAYGPATQRELLRWWGVAVVAMLKPALEELGDGLTHVEVDGVRAYARTADLDALVSTRPTRGHVRLVGGFDPLVVGAGLRDQLIPPAHLKRVSRTAGWISPVVLVDGIARGVWDLAREGGSMSITVEPFEELGGGLRAKIHEAAADVGHAHGTRATVRYGRVFAGPKKSQRFNDR